MVGNDISNEVMDASLITASNVLTPTALPSVHTDEMYTRIITDHTTHVHMHSNLWQHTRVPRISVSVVLNRSETRSETSCAYQQSDHNYVVE